MHTKKDVSLAKEFQKYLSNYDRKYGAIDQGKDSKIATKIKWSDREHHVQDNSDAAHKDVKMYCDNNKLPSLPCLGFTYKASWSKGVG